MYSAGILPYQVLENNQIFFLLGKGTDGTWSDFGGKADPKDKNNIKETAAREFYEESMGSVLGLQATRNALKNEKNYELVNSSSMSGLRYYMFILRVPIIPDICIDRFNKTNDFLMYQQQNGHRVPYEYTEKTDIALVSLDTLFSLLQHENMEQVLGWPLRKVFRKTLLSCRDKLYQLKTSVS
jgi:lipopolysaccharide assembly outer membrane protein LptD (OstA)